MIKKVLSAGITKESLEQSIENALSKGFEILKEKEIIQEKEERERKKVLTEEAMVILKKLPYIIQQEVANGNTFVDVVNLKKGEYVFDSRQQRACQTTDVEGTKVNVLFDYLQKYNPQIVNAFCEAMNEHTYILRIILLRKD